MSDLISVIRHLEDKNEQIKQQLESLKHDYREKLGYLSSNKWTDKTAISVEMERLEKEELRDRLEYEVKMIEGAANDEINRLKQQLEDLKYDLNNSKSFHCPNFLTNDSGYVSCQVKEYGYRSYESLFKEAVEVIEEVKDICDKKFLLNINDDQFASLRRYNGRVNEFLAKYRGESE